MHSNSIPATRTDLDPAIPSTLKAARVTASWRVNLVISRYGAGGQACSDSVAHFDDRDRSFWWCCPPEIRWDSVTWRIYGVWPLQVWPVRACSVTWRNTPGDDEGQPGAPRTGPIRRLDNHQGVWLYL